MERGGIFRLCAGMATSAALCRQQQRTREIFLQNEEERRKKRGYGKKKTKRNYSFTIHSYHLSATCTAITSLSRAPLPSSAVFTSGLFSFDAHLKVCKILLKKTNVHFGAICLYLPLNVTSRGLVPF